MEEEKEREQEHQEKKRKRKKERKRNKDDVGIEEGKKGLKMRLARKIKKIVAVEDER